MIKRSPLLCLAVVAFLSACMGSVGDQGSDPSASADRQGNDLANIPHFPSSDVCSTGPYRCFARVRVLDSGQRWVYASASGIGPADIQSAYNLNAATDPGATVAIVDAYGYSNAESDLAQYRSHYGLPPCTVANGCLKIVNQSGQTSPLPPNPPANDDWTVETALDLDMASAACPKCKLLLVQAQDNSGNGLFVAQNTAAQLGATVISNSWGGPESGGESSTETYFNHPGVAIFVASGDSGYDDGGQGPDYPSTSQFVFGVGGTSLVKSTSNARGWSEGAWSSGGSSCSNSIAKPSWQSTTPEAWKSSTPRLRNFAKRCVPRITP